MKENLKALDVKAIVATSVSHGAKPKENHEERPKPKKIRQVWVRKFWMPHGTFDSMKDDQETSFTWAGKWFKLVKPCAFLERKARKPPGWGYEAKFHPGQNASSQRH